MREWFLAGRGEEAVDVLLLDAIVLRVLLALDRVEFVGALGLRNQVDAGVACIQSLCLRPVRVHPDIAVEVAIGRFATQISAYQLFEISSFFTLRGGCLL